MGLYRRGKTYWLTMQHEGKRIHRSIKTSNKRLAEKRYSKTINDIVEGSFFETSKLKK